MFTNWLVELNLRPSLRKKYGTSAVVNSMDLGSNSQRDQFQAARRDEEILKNMWWMITFGLSIFLGGFAIWTLDNKYCSTLRRWRHEIGLPWGIFLEGHGWWSVPVLD
jgi:dihydroceramidase